MVDVESGGALADFRPIAGSLVSIRAAAGVYALIEPLKAGTATITATSEGKSGTAVVTVRARP
jgi:uncharacterized protein YjdB